MFIKSISKVFNNTYNAFTDNGFDNVDPNIIKYFRIEYGKDWQSALEHHQYQKSIKNKKKAA